MSHSFVRRFPGRRTGGATKDQATDNGRHRRLGRSGRVLAITAICAAVLIAGAAGSGFLFVNNMLGGIHRISGLTALAAANEPVMPVATRGSITILMIASQELPPKRNHKGVLGSSTLPQAPSGLISLVHLNKDRRAGGVVSIPPNTVVSVPHHKPMQLWDTLAVGGPDLLIRTVMRLTNVRIDHYAVLDLSQLGSILKPLGGVDVIVPRPVLSKGFFFHAGLNHINAANAYAYTSQNAVSQVGRGQLQQNLLRAMIHKIGRIGPLQEFRVIQAIAAALSVDSNFTNAEMATLAKQLANLRGSAAIFLNAPTNGSPTKGGTKPVYLRPRLSAELWQAIRHDALRAFGQKYPFTITPIAPV